MMSFHDITKESLYDIRYFDDKDSAILNELLMNPQIQKWFPLLRPWM